MENNNKASISNLLDNLGLDIASEEVNDNEVKENNKEKVEKIKESKLNFFNGVLAIKDDNSNINYIEVIDLTAKEAIDWTKQVLFVTNEKYQDSLFQAIAENLENKISYKNLVENKLNSNQIQMLVNYVWLLFIDGFKLGGMYIPTEERDIDKKKS